MRFLKKYKDVIEIDPFLFVLIYFKLEEKMFYTPELLSNIGCLCLVPIWCQS